MRELGTRTEGDELITIVELSEYELSVLRGVLEKRDLGMEAAGLKAWRDRFTSEVSGLNLDVRTSNALMRQVWDRVLATDDVTFSITGASAPMEFDAWARHIVRTHDATGKPSNMRVRPMLEVRNCGARCKAAIMAALANVIAQRDAANMWCNEWKRRADAATAERDALAAELATVRAQDVSTMTIEQLRDLRDAISKRLLDAYRAQPQA